MLITWRALASSRFVGCTCDHFFGIFGTFSASSGALIHFGVSLQAHKSCKRKAAAGGPRSDEGGAACGGTGPGCGGGSCASTARGQGPSGRVVRASTSLPVPPAAAGTCYGERSPMITTALVVARGAPRHWVPAAGDGHPLCKHACGYVGLLADKCPGQTASCISVW